MNNHSWVKKQACIRIGDICLTSFNVTNGITLVRSEIFLHSILPKALHFTCTVIEFRHQPPWTRKLYYPQVDFNSQEHQIWFHNCFKYIKRRMTDSYIGSFRFSVIFFQSLLGAFSFPKSAHYLFSRKMNIFLHWQPATCNKMKISTFALCSFLRFRFWIGDVLHFVWI